MKKRLSILTCVVLITGIISSNAFADPINDIDIPDKKVSLSEMFYSNDNYHLNIDIQNTTSDYFVKWGVSVAQSDAGYIRAQGFTQSYMNVGTIGYTLYVEKYVSMSWITIQTFSYSLNNTSEAIANHSLAVDSNNSYRVRSTNYIINNGVQTTKTSIGNTIFIN